MTRFILPYQHEPGKWLIAEGTESFFLESVANEESWKKLNHWIEDHPGFKFGWMSYTSGNHFQGLLQTKDSRDSFPQLFFFTPKNLMVTDGKEFQVLKGNYQEDYANWISFQDHSQNEQLVLESETSRDEYLQAVKNLLQHIQQGDIYEVNYCQILSAQAKLENPLDVWKKLYTLTEAPHAVYAEHQQWHALCASPERFIAKRNRKIISQPIKGTIRRDTNHAKDLQLKSELVNSEKERSENVMIVDLVRNDLSKIAEPATVQVEELFGAKTFKTVHHLVSTITCNTKEKISFDQIFEAAFPMGSMTGAPKSRALTLIRQYEKTTRGLYSGSIGYIAPNGDFDFNVVIRSILYDSSLPRIYAGVGSAITATCDPHKEYEECMLKAKALLDTLRS